MMSLKKLSLLQKILAFFIMMFVMITGFILLLLIRVFALLSSRKKPQESSTPELKEPIPGEIVVLSKRYRLAKDLLKK